MSLLAAFSKLPYPIQSKILFSYLLIPHPNVLQLKKNTIVLKYTRKTLFTRESYINLIWENLRPSNLKKTFYGDENGEFIIIRNKLSLREVIILRRSLNRF